MGSKTILIVEDHPDCRELLAVVLARSGYGVIKAATGLEAIARARETVPDLILMDFGLPGMTGDKIIMRLKEDPSTEKIPVIVTTGYLDANVARRAVVAGAVKVLVKPFELDGLLAAMQQCLSSEPDRNLVSSETAIPRDRLNTVTPE